MRDKGEHALERLERGAGARRVEHDHIGAQLSLDQRLQTLLQVVGNEFRIRNSVQERIRFRVLDRRLARLDADHGLCLLREREGKIPDAAVEVEHGLAPRERGKVQHRPYHVPVLFPVHLKKISFRGFEGHAFDLERELVPPEGKGLFSARESGHADNFRRAFLQVGEEEVHRGERLLFAEEQEMHFS